MAEFVEHMVKWLNLSGFVGFDFILDSLNRAWLIEINPRVTQISHFSLPDGTDMVASLYMQMTGQRPLSRIATCNSGPIALFPNEIVRSPTSQYLQSCPHDVPWDEPELVRSVLNQTLRTGITRRVRTMLDRYAPTLVRLLGAALLTLGVQSPLELPEDALAEPVRCERHHAHVPT
jgi:hypothetical protein